MATLSNQQLPQLPQLKECLKNAQKPVAKQRTPMKQAQYIKQIIMTRCGTLGQAAKQTGLSKSHLSKIMNGKRELTQKTAETLSQKLGIPTQTLRNHCPTCGKKITQE